jgi:hypothetical protein
MDWARSAPDVVELDVWTVDGLAETAIVLADAGEEWADGAAR